MGPRLTTDPARFIMNLANGTTENYGGVSNKFIRLICIAEVEDKYIQKFVLSIITKKIKDFFCMEKIEFISKTSQNFTESLIFSNFFVESKKNTCKAKLPCIAPDRSHM